MKLSAPVSNGVGIARDLARSSPVLVIFVGAMLFIVWMFMASLKERDQALGNTLRDLYSAISSNTGVLNRIDQREQRREERRQERQERQ